MLFWGGGDECNILAHLDEAAAEMQGAPVAAFSHLIKCEQEDAHRL